MQATDERQYLRWMDETRNKTKYYLIKYQYLQNLSSYVFFPFLHVTRSTNGNLQKLKHDFDICSVPVIFVRHDINVFLYHAFN